MFRRPLHRPLSAIVVMDMGLPTLDNKMGIIQLGYKPSSVVGRHTSGLAIFPLGTYLALVSTHVPLLLLLVHTVVACAARPAGHPAAVA